MPVESGPSPQEQSKPNLIQEIYGSSPTPVETSAVAQVKKEVLQEETDPYGVRLYQELRSKLSNLDTPEGWKNTRELAKRELDELPDDVFERLLKVATPYIKQLPAGHGKGHFLRDAVNLTGMLNDPKFATNKIDEVELLAGMFGGMFHDIGNSITERYHDAVRVGAHAEVGAKLFGTLAEQVMPEAPHLTSLIQYAIAGHTHYLNEREVKLKDGTVVGKTQPYIDEVDAEENRLAMWLTRQSDRRDTANLPFLVRNFILNVKPIKDFDGKKFMETAPPDENFKIKFGLNPEAYNIPPEKAKSVIQHCMMFATNVYNKDVAYTKHDSPYFTEQLMTPGIEDTALFLEVLDHSKKEALVKSIEEKNPAMARRIDAYVRDNQAIADVEKTKPLTPENIQKSVDRFLTLCKVMEPAQDTDELAKAFRDQFFRLLTPQDQEAYARGFNLLTGHTFNRWRRTANESISSNPNLSRKIRSANPKVQKHMEDLGSHIQSIASSVLASMDLPKAA